MERSVLASVLVIGVAATMLGAGTMAYFNDTETSEGNTFTAGTLDLTVNDQNPYTEHITFDNIAPGFYGSRVYKIKNIGTIDGKLSIEISAITNNDNGLTDPESDVDNTGGAGEGELGHYLNIKLERRNPNKGIFPWDRLNDHGGTTRTTAGGEPMILHPGDEWNIRLELRLNQNVGNIIQSDSVEFDVVFCLEQA